MNIEVFFDAEDLKPALAAALSGLFLKPVTAAEIHDLTFESDPEEDEVIGVTIELSRNPPDESV
jgi:hypothetical protein